MATSSSSNLLIPMSGHGTNKEPRNAHRLFTAPFLHDTSVQTGLCEKACYLQLRHVCRRLSSARKIIRWHDDVLLFLSTTTITTTTKWFISLLQQWQTGRTREENRKGKDKNKDPPISLCGCAYMYIRTAFCAKVVCGVEKKVKSECVCVCVWESDPLSSTPAHEQPDPLDSIQKGGIMFPTIRCAYIPSSSPPSSPQPFPIPNAHFPFLVSPILR